MSTTVSYRGYHGSIIYDEVDELYHGMLLGIRGVIIYHGDTPEEAEKIFREAVDDYIAEFQKEGSAPPEPFADFPARLPEQLQVKAALYAQEHDLKVEQVLEAALTNFLGQAA